MLGGDVPVITMRPVPSAQGFVYCVRRPDSRSIKIGYTRDIQLRLNGLQSANDARLQLLFYFRATLRCEERLLVQFERWRLRGEWFASCREIEAWVRQQRRVEGVIVPRGR